jgi:hypothetical protein
MIAPRPTSMLRHRNAPAKPSSGSCSSRHAMPTVAAVLRRHGGEYLDRFGTRMPALHRQVLGTIRACRTGALGKVLQPDRRTFVPQPGRRPVGALADATGLCDPGCLHAAYGGGRGARGGARHLGRADARRPHRGGGAGRVGRWNDRGRRRRRAGGQGGPKGRREEREGSEGLRGRRLRRVGGGHDQREAPAAKAVGTR